MCLAYLERLLVNLFCIIPNDSDATSFYRGATPIGALRKVAPFLNVTFSGASVTPKDLCTADVLFIQRPMLAAHVSVAQLAKDLGAKVWIDFDDALLDVAASNPAAKVFNNPQTHRAIGDLIQIADLVSVSTEELKNIYSKKIGLAHKYRVIPNAWNDYIQCYPQPFKNSNRVVWRGSDSHLESLMEETASLNRFLEGTTHPEVFFMGHHPWYLKQGLQNVHNVPHQEIFNYFRTLSEIRPAIAFATLHDSPFNKCKSNIAWIEATYAGATFVGPDFPEFEKPGITNYNSGSLGYMLTKQMESSTTKLQELHEESWEYIKANYRLSEVNKLRAQLLREIVTK